MSLFFPLRAWDVRAFLAERFECLLSCCFCMVMVFGFCEQDCPSAWFLKLRCNQQVLPRSTQSNFPGIHPHMLNVPGQI